MEGLSTLFGDDIVEPTLLEPEEPQPKAGTTILTKVQERIYEAQINMYVKEVSSLRSATRALYYIAWGQCSALMQNRLELDKD